MLGIVRTTDFRFEVDYFPTGDLFIVEPLPRSHSKIIKYSHLKLRLSMLGHLLQCDDAFLRKMYFALVQLYPFQQAYPHNEVA